MKTFGDLGLAEIKKLFSQKKEYLINSNFEGLISLKKNYPFLFDSQQEAEYHQLLEYINVFSSLPHIQHQLREEKKSRLIEVNVDKWNLEEYEELLKTASFVNVSNIKEFSRALVRNSILISSHIFSEIHNTEKDTVFASMGFLLAEILNSIDVETRLKHVGRIIHLLIGNLKFSSDEEKSSNISISIKKIMKEKFRDQFLKLFLKFDKRLDFQKDTVFFCLVAITEYISLIKILFTEADNMNILKEILANMIESTEGREG
jgi:hypothetical protein